MVNNLLFRCVSAGLLLAAAWSGPAQAALGSLGPAIQPHGYPAYYSDGSLALEPCLPAEQFADDGAGTLTAVGNSTRPDLCVFDPIDPANPDSVKLGVGSESFWWMSDAVMTMPAGGRAVLVLGLEGAFGGVGDPADGQQIAFGRIRIRVDTPTAGTYTVTHPYGSQQFVVTDPAAGINVTSDIGAINQLQPEFGFPGALKSEIGPFLTWPGYAIDPSLQVRAIDPVTQLPTGPVLEQYVGDPNIPHVVTGSPTGNNFFRVQGPNGLDVQTELFSVMGKVYNPAVAKTAYVFPESPLPNLFAVGPVNRVAAFNPATVGSVTAVDHTGYPVGFPLWFQDTVLLTDANGAPVIDPLTQLQQREGGLQLTYCPPTDAMCISAPIDPADANSGALRVGEEGFFWTGEAFINEDTADVPNLPAGLDGILVMAIEGAFGNTGVPLEGQQIAFARVRIRIDTPVAGTYTVTHPYGVEVFENVPADRRAINLTRDIMISDPADPDGAFIGAIYGDIGPKFLTWPNFDTDARLQKLSDPTVPTSPVIQYIGDPAVEHAVTGSPTGSNFFRIQGPGGIDVRTSLFAVTGKVFDEATFNVVANPALPVANPDAASLNLAQAPSVVIDVAAKDTVPGNVPVTIAIATPPVDGTAVVDNAAGTITYTPGAALAAEGGSDTLAYNLTITGSPLFVSNNAEVTVTVVPVETIAFGQARFDLRKLRLDLRGTSNFEGSVLTIREGNTASGAVLGTAVVTNGRWGFRGTTTTNLTSVTLVSNSAAATTVTQPLQVR